jgi:hypothetical protein
VMALPPINKTPLIVTLQSPRWNHPQISQRGKVNDLWVAVLDELLPCATPALPLPLLGVNPPLLYCENLPVDPLILGPLP